MDGDKIIIDDEKKKEEESEKKLALSIFSSALVLFVSFFIFNSFFSSSIFLASLQDSTYLDNQSSNDSGDSSSVLAAESLDTTESNVTEVNTENTPVEAKQYVLNLRSAIVVKVTPTSKEIVFESNKDKKIPIASLTKLMTALLVLEIYDLDIKTTIDQKAMSQVGEQGSLKLGEILSVKDLLYISLIESSNRSAHALAEVFGVDNFVSLMNQRAEELGMANTHFSDSSGLDSNSQSSVSDLAILSEYLYKNQSLFKEIVSLDEYDLYLDNGTFHHKLTNTNKLLETLPGVVGGKTGFTNEARGCYMVINKVHPNEDTYFINIILGSEDRSSAIKYLIDNYNF